MNKSSKILAFGLPVVPWVLVLIPHAAGWFSDDSWTALGLAIFLAFPTVALLFGCGFAGTVCSLRCWRQTKQKRYWLSLALATVTLCYGAVCLLQLLQGM